jgi:hypothetical protein
MTPWRRTTEFRDTEYLSNLRRRESPPQDYQRWPGAVARKVEGHITSVAWGSRRPLTTNLTSGDGEALSVVNNHDAAWGGESPRRWVAQTRTRTNGRPTWLRKRSWACWAQAENAHRTGGRGQALSYADEHRWGPGPPCQPCSRALTFAARSTLSRRSDAPRAPNAPPAPRTPGTIVGHELLAARGFDSVEEPFRFAHDRPTRESRWLPVRKVSPMNPPLGIATLSPGTVKVRVKRQTHARLGQARKGLGLNSREPCHSCCCAGSEHGRRTPEPTFRLHFRYRVVEPLAPRVSGGPEFTERQRVVPPRSPGYRDEPLVTLSRRRPSLRHRRERRRVGSGDTPEATNLTDTEQPSASGQKTTPAPRHCRGLVVPPRNPDHDNPRRQCSPGPAISRRTKFLRPLSSAP